MRIPRGPRGSPKICIRHFSTLGSTCPDNLQNTFFHGDLWRISCAVQTGLMAHEHGDICFVRCKCKLFTRTIVQDDDTSCVVFIFRRRMCRLHERNQRYYEMNVIIFVKVLLAQIFGNHKCRVSFIHNKEHVIICVLNPNEAQLKNIFIS